MIEYQLDTNVILRYLSRQNSKKNIDFIKLIRDAQEGKISIILSEPVMLETAVGLRNYYKFPREKVANLLRIICNLDWLTIENKDIVISALHYYEIHSLDFVDCLILARIKISKQKVFSFDEKLNSVAAEKSI